MTSRQPDPAYRPGRRRPHRSRGLGRTVRRGRLAGPAASHQTRISIWRGESGRSGVLAVATGIRSADREQAATETARDGPSAAPIRRPAVPQDRLDRTRLHRRAGRGALTAWQVDHPDAVAVICPAFPDLGRTVLDGQVLVNGQPVHETAAAVDPVTPMTQSRLESIIDGAVRVDISQLESEQRRPPAVRRREQRRPRRARRGPAAGSDPAPSRSDQPGSPPRRPDCGPIRIAGAGSPAAASRGQRGCSSRSAPCTRRPLAQAERLQADS